MSPPVPWQPSVTRGRVAVNPVLAYYLIRVEQEFEDHGVVCAAKEVGSMFPMVVHELPGVLVEGGTLELACGQDAIVQGRRGRV